MRCKARQHGRPDCYNAIRSILCAGLSVPNVTANTSDASVADEDSGEVTILDTGCTFGHSKGRRLNNDSSRLQLPSLATQWEIASVSILKPTRYCPQASGERPTHGKNDQANSWQDVGKVSFIVCHNETMLSASTDRPLCDCNVNQSASVQCLCTSIIGCVQTTTCINVSTKSFQCVPTTKHSSLCAS